MNLTIFLWNIDTIKRWLVACYNGADKIIFKIGLSGIIEPFNVAIKYLAPVIPKDFISSIQNIERTNPKYLLDMNRVKFHKNI